MNVNDLGWITESRNPTCFFQACADDKPSVVDAMGVLGKQSLSRGIHTPSEEPPLPSVGVTADDQIDGIFLQIGLIVFRMMAQEDARGIHAAKILQPGKVWHTVFVDQS